MSIGEKVKGVLSTNGKKASGLASVLGADNKGISTQALSNKFYRDSFSVEDLISVAEYANCELAFISTNGSKIVLEREDIKPKKAKDE